MKNQIKNLKFPSKSLTDRMVQFSGVKQFLFGCFMLFAAAAFCPSAFADVSVEGPWETTEGTMTMEQLPGQEGVRAAYGLDQGRIIGQLENARVSGRWIENQSERRCNSEVDGSYYWGRIQFDFSPDGSVFEGQWGYCENKLASPWTGKRPADYAVKKSGSMKGWVWLALIMGIIFLAFILSKIRKK